MANILHPATINRLRSTCSPVTALVKCFQISHGVDLISLSCKLITILVFLLPKDATAQQSPLKLDFYLYLHQINFFHFQTKKWKFVCNFLTRDVSLFHCLTLQYKLYLEADDCLHEGLRPKIHFRYWKIHRKEQINIKKMSWEKWFKIHLNNNWDNSLMFSDARINIRFGVMTLNVARFSWK